MSSLFQSSQRNEWFCDRFFNSKVISCYTVVVLKIDIKIVKSAAFANGEISDLKNGGSRIVIMIEALVVINNKRNENRVLLGGTPRHRK